MCESRDWFLLHNAPSHNVTIVKQFLAQEKGLCWTRFRTCWLLFFPKSEIPLKGVSLDSISDIQKAVTSTLNTFANDDFLQRHPKAVWLCKYVCTVGKYVCRKLNNKSVISFKQILFITPVLKLSKRTVYFKYTFLCLKTNKYVVQFITNTSWARNHQFTSVPSTCM
jgi:hypothetical protein